MENRGKMKMLDSKEIMDKLYALPEMFRHSMNSKDYARAKHYYDTARTVSLFLDLDGPSMTELFGERGERGDIVVRGLFSEESVQLAYRKCIEKNETREKQRYPGIPKAGHQ